MVAIARLPAGATPFAHRDVFANMLLINTWRFGEDVADHIQTDSRQNDARLVKVKNQFNPTNLFRMNANIRPNVKAGPIRYARYRTDGAMRAQ